MNREVTPDYVGFSFDINNLIEYTPCFCFHLRCQEVLPTDWDDIIVSFGKCWNQRILTRV